MSNDSAPSSTQAEEVAQNIAWLAEAQTVSPALWVEAKALGLLPADIPTAV